MSLAPAPGVLGVLTTLAGTGLLSSVRCAMVTTHRSDTVNRATSNRRLPKRLLIISIFLPWIVAKEGIWVTSDCWQSSYQCRPFGCLLPADSLQIAISCDRRTFLL